jgi:uncharacterized protein
MNRKIIKLSVFLLLAVIMPYKTAAADTLQPTDVFYVNDYADVINEDVEEDIITYGGRLEEQTGAQVVVVTVDFTDGETLENYALELFNEWGIGSGEKNNGVLILLSIGDDDYWVMQGEGLEDTLTSGKISGILQEYLEPDFAAKDYSAGVEKTYEAFIRELGGQWKDSGSETVKDGGSQEAAEDGSEAADRYTFDFAHIISDEDRDYINEKSTEAAELYGAGVYVVTKYYRDKADDFEEDAINTFEDLKAGSRDVLLVLYKEDDNYRLLPGEETEKFTTEAVLRRVLDNVLEPEFAAGDYSQGAKDTADQFYGLFQKNYKAAERGASPDNAETSARSGNVGLFWGACLFILVGLLILSSRRRRHTFGPYGAPYVPYRRGFFRGHHHHGYWGGHPHPPMGGGNFHGGMAPPDNDRGAGRTSSGGGFWGSGGGAGRSSSGSSFSGGGSSHGGGGLSRGGGAGRSSGGFGGSGSSGRASGGGRSASGGGGASRGGGAGRRK